MNLRRISLMIVAVALFGMVALSTSHRVFADTISTYSSCFQIVNQDADEAASVVMEFFDQDDPNNPVTVSDTIPADDSNTYCPLPGEVPAGFRGSARISSTKPVAAIANILGDATQNSSYSGFSAGSETIALPLIQRDYFNVDTWFNVQNAGASDTTVTVSYAGAPSCDQTATIAPGAAATFDQATYTCLGSGYNNSATVTASPAGSSIVASALQVANIGLFAYNGIAQSSADVVMPLVQWNNFGFQTGIQIQNQGGSPTTVTVRYTPATAGTECTETITIPDGGSETFGLYAFTDFNTTPSTTCIEGEQFVGAATVDTNSGNEPLAVIINQSNFTNNGLGSAYNGFDPNAATDTVIMPLIMDAYSFWTGYNVMNVGNNTVTVTCTYSGTSFTENDTLMPGEAYNSQQLDAVANGDLPANTSGGYIGSGSCTAPGGQIVAVVNQVQTGASGDGLLTHEAFSP